MKIGDDPLEDLDGRAELDGRIAAVATARNPYWPALQVMGGAVDYLVSSVIASRLYQVWGALTDRYELQPEGRSETLSEMKRAANEWLAARHSRTAREAYLDHWQYEVLGCPRAGD
jgi:hypothetical protein